MSWDYTVPDAAATHSCLLAVVSADEDPITTAETNVDLLIKSEKRVCLKNLHVVESDGPRPQQTMATIRFNNMRDHHDVMDIIIRPTEFSEGTIALLLAGLFLFDGAPTVRAPVLWPTALVLGGASAWAGRMAWHARRAPSTTGFSTLVGREVMVAPRDAARGDAFLDGSWWTVRPEEGELETGPGEVVAVDGLTLVVQQTGVRENAD